MRRAGFTLVEVLIITGFITLLFFGALWLWYPAEAPEERALQWVRELRRAEKTYLQEHGRYFAWANSVEDAYPSQLPSPWGEGPKNFAALGLTVPQEPLSFRIAIFAGALSPMSSCVEQTTLCKSAPKQPMPWFYLAVLHQATNKIWIEDASWNDSGPIVYEVLTEANQKTAPQQGAAR